MTNKILELIRRGKQPGADRVLIYGPEGVGKSTFAGQAEDVVFQATEDGVRFLDTASLPEPKTFSDVLEQYAALIDGEHEFKTLVIDTLDWLEALIIEAVCDENDWKSIEDPGWGKGFVQVGLKWRQVISHLDRLRAKGMQIILVAHSDVKMFNSPDEEGYSRFTLAMSKVGSAICKQWVDSVLFARYETFTKKGKDQQVKGMSSGRRLLHTTWKAAYDAKNRCGLPEEILLSWDDYKSARDSDGADAVKSLKEQCAALVASFEEEDKQKKAAKYIAGLGDDVAKLSGGLDWLREKLEAQEEGSE